MAVGGPGNDGNGSGSGNVWVYTNIGIYRIKVGDDIYGLYGVDYSGYSVAISSGGKTVNVGSFGNDGDGINSEHVQVHAHNDNYWVNVDDDINV